jgi:hypothetical protein
MLSADVDVPSLANCSTTPPLLLLSPLLLLLRCCTSQALVGSVVLRCWQSMV